MPNPAYSTEEKFAEYPPPAFYFTVKITGPASGPAIPDSSFQEVSGISTKIEFETVREGGENGFEHKLPSKTTHGNLVLKRGLVARNSGLYQWCAPVLEEGIFQNIKPVSMDVVLNAVDGQPLCTWNLTNVVPVKWEIGGFGSTKNEVAVETIELSYNTVKRI